jgi:hypothetical protein
MIKRAIALLACVAFTAMGTCVGVDAQTVPSSRPLAVILHVTTDPLLKVDGKPQGSARERLIDLAEGLDSWQEPDAGFPISLAVSPVLCDELELLATQEARRVLSSLRSLAPRADVLSAPYADVNLRYLVRDDEVRTEIERGRLKLRDCLAKRPIDVLMPPAFDLDDQAVDAARSVGIDTSLSNRTGVAVRSEATDEHGAITLVPRTDATSAAEGNLQGALVVPAADPSWASRVATAAAANEVEVVTLERLTDGALRIFVDFPDRETTNDETRRAVVRARRNVESFDDFTLAGNPLRKRFRALYARALASASLAQSDEDTDPDNQTDDAAARQSEDLADAIGNEAEKVTTVGGSFLFSARRGKVPITVTNRASYPVRVRINVSSPKVDFPDGTSQVVTVEPPGNSRVEFSAITRSTGTFPILVRLTSPDRTLAFDTAELSVRSTAINISALVLTAGGAFFLIAWAVRRRGRKRAAP